MVCHIYKEEIHIPKNTQKSRSKTIGEKNATIGIVTDCLWLNLRDAPEPDAAVVTVIPALSEVSVDLDASTEHFYKVYTTAGIEGFCMKKYITLRS